MASKQDIKAVVDQALAHAQDHDYRPLADDRDMLETGIFEASLELDIVLSRQDKETAISELISRLPELDEPVG